MELPSSTHRTLVLVLCLGCAGRGSGPEAIARLERERAAHPQSEPRYAHSASFITSHETSRMQVRQRRHRRLDLQYWRSLHRAEDIANLLVAVGIGAVRGLLEPSLELRRWMQENLSASTLATAGLRHNVKADGFAITPTAGYTLGRFASPGRAASISGVRGAIAVRFGS